MSTLKVRMAWQNWIEPIVSLAVYHGLNSVKLNEIERIVEKHKNEIIKKWQEYFGKR